MTSLWVKVIAKGGVTYKNMPWHRDCFTCTHCTKVLAGEKFTSRDDKPYCANCFSNLFAKKCCRCSQPITGRSNVHWFGKQSTRHRTPLKQVKLV